MDKTKSLPSVRYILVQKELNSSLILYLEDTVGTQRRVISPELGHQETTLEFLKKIWRGHEGEVMRNMRKRVAKSVSYVVKCLCLQLKAQFQV